MEVSAEGLLVKVSEEEVDAPIDHMEVVISL